MVNIINNVGQRQRTFDSEVEDAVSKAKFTIGGRSRPRLNLNLDRAAFQDVLSSAGLAEEDVLTELARETGDLDDQNPMVGIFTTDPSAKVFFGSEAAPGGSNWLLVAPGDGPGGTTATTYSLRIPTNPRTLTVSVRFGDGSITPREVVNLRDARPGSVSFLYAIPGFGFVDRSKFARISSEQAMSGAQAEVLDQEDMVEFEPEGPSDLDVDFGLGEIEEEFDLTADDAPLDDSILTDEERVQQDLAEMLAEDAAQDRASTLKKVAAFVGIAGLIGVGAYVMKEAL